MPPADLPRRGPVPEVRRSAYSAGWPARAVAWLLMPAILAASCGGEEIGDVPAATQSSFVAEILSDGNVTAAEMERSVFRVLQCLDERGVTYTEPVLKTDRDAPRWDFVISTPGELNPNEPTPYDLCYAEFQFEVESKWVDQHRPSEIEIQRRNEEALKCLNASGIDVQDLQIFVATRSSLPPELRQAAQECLRRTVGGVDEP